MYYKDKRLGELGKWLVTGLLSIRFTVLFFISFFLLSPVIKYLQLNLENPIVIFAQDNSESIGLTNLTGAKSTSEYNTKIKTFQNNLAQKFEVKNYSFGSQLIETTDYKYLDKETDFTSLFQEINSKFINYNIGALVIASDGIYNKGLNPLYSSKNLGFPIYTIALGDTSKKRDIIIKNVYANKITFLGDYFPIEVSLNSYGFQNQDIKVRILNNGKEIVKQSIQIDKNDFSRVLNFDIIAETKGLQNFVVEAEYKKGEFDLKNNSKEIAIDIVDDKKKILILANSVHPDVGAIRKALETNKNIISESFVFDEFKGNISDYQLVIFHQLPSLQSNVQRLISEINKKLIPVLFIIGPQSDVQSFNALKSGINISGNNRLLEQSLANLNPTFSLFETDEKLNDFIAQCPPLLAPFGNYTNDNQIDVLFYQQIKGIKTDKPLLCFSKSKPGINGKYAFLIGDGIWRWRMKDYQLNENHLQFDALINKVVHFLALDVQKDRFLVYHNKIMNENEDINFRAEFYNQSFELNNNSDVSFEILNAENKVYKYQFSKTDKSYILNIGMLPIGNYKYLAKLEFEGKEYLKKGEFKVSELNVEHQDLTANHSILYQIAAQTNGKMYYANQLDSLLDELKNRDTIKPVSRSILDLVDLIELKWIFFLLMFLLTLEWFLRKFFGSY